MSNFGNGFYARATAGYHINPHGIANQSPHSLVGFVKFGPHLIAILLDVLKKCACMDSAFNPISLPPQRGSNVSIFIDALLPGGLTAGFS